MGLGGTVAHSHARWLFTQTLEMIHKKRKINQKKPFTFFLSPRILEMAPVGTHRLPAERLLLDPALPLVNAHAHLSKQLVRRSDERRRYCAGCTAASGEPTQSTQKRGPQRGWWLAVAHPLFGRTRERPAPPSSCRRTCEGQASSGHRPKAATIRRLLAQILAPFQTET